MVIFLCRHRLLPCCHFSVDISLLPLNIRLTLKWCITYSGHILHCSIENMVYIYVGTATAIGIHVNSIFMCNDMHSFCGSTLCSVHMFGYISNQWIIIAFAHTLENLHSTANRLLIPQNWNICGKYLLFRFSFIQIVVVLCVFCLIFGFHVTNSISLNWNGSFQTNILISCIFSEIRAKIQCNQPYLYNLF